jgi:hypothetical protein
MSSGSWAFGAYNKDVFAFNAGGSTTPAMIIASDGRLVVRKRSGAAAPALKHTNTSANVIRLGSYYIGMKDDDHFVINRVDTAAHVAPQLVISKDGELFTPATRFSLGSAPWVIQGNEGPANIIRVGDWYMGEALPGDFTISKAGASRPGFLLNLNGETWSGQQVGPLPSSFFMAVPQCKDQDVPEYAEAFKSTAWTLASKSGNAVISRAGASGPSMVLGESQLTANFKGMVMSGRELQESDANVVTLNGWWRVGFHDDVFVISTVADHGVNWPQFVLDTSGTIHASEMVATAGSEWSLNGSHVVRAAAHRPGPSHFVVDQCYV